MARTGIVCKGSIALGSACGNCEKCGEEMTRIREAKTKPRDPSTDGFTYTNILSKGCEGWINLFFGQQVIAMINSPELAAKMKEKIPEFAGYHAS